MTISQNLVDRYTNEVDVDWWEGIALSHSTFAQTYYLHNAPTEDSLVGNMDGGPQTFTMVPFDVSLPARDSGGRGDLPVSLAAVGNTLNLALDGALSVPTEPIVLKYTTYLFTDPTPMYDPPLEFSLTNIGSSEQGHAGVARTGDVLNKTFPNGRYHVSTFPGLRRR